MKQQTKNNKPKKPRKKYTRKKGSNPPGSPIKYSTAEEMQNVIDRYFKECDKKKKPYTVTGLAIALDFTTRQALINYESEKRESLREEEKKKFVDTIKKAKLRIEQYAENNLYEGRQIAGTIFNLKNNYGWIDQQNVQHGGDVIINIKGLTKF